VPLQRHYNATTDVSAGAQKRLKRFIEGVNASPVSHWPLGKVF